MYAAFQLVKHKLRIICTNTFHTQLGALPLQGWNVMQDYGLPNGTQTQPCPAENVGTKNNDRKR